MVARIRSQTGPITESDRKIIIALADRFARLMAQWQTLMEHPQSA